jgi:hypothetical protein
MLICRREIDLARSNEPVGVTTVAGFKMDQLIAAPACDPLGALKRVAVRDSLANRW